MMTKKKTFEQYFFEIMNVFTKLSELGIKVPNVNFVQIMMKAILDSYDSFMQQYTS